MFDDKNQIYDIITLHKYALRCHIYCALHNSFIFTGKPTISKSSCSFFGVIMPINLKFMCDGNYCGSDIFYSSGSLSRSSGNFL